MARLSAACLLLNASYEPMTVVSTQRALILILADKAEYVETDDSVTFRGARHEFPAPVVIRLLKYVRVPHNTHIGLSRRSVYARDRGKCVYCGKPGDTMDHVMPRSRGGQHTWDNVVLCCFKCNNDKRDRTLAEMGWTINPPPRAPVGTAWRIIGFRKPDPRWNSYLGDKS